MADQPRKTARVLIVDDAPELRALIRHNLSRRGDLEVVGEAEGGIVAIQRCGELLPDLIICDITMPRLGGIEALPRMAAEAPEARILMLSSREDELSVTQAMSAGAHGYLVKSGSRQK